MNKTKAQLTKIMTRRPDLLKNLNISTRQLFLFIDYLIANGVAVRQWTPANKCPPKTPGTYLVCTDKGGILLAHWYGDHWGGGYAAKHITHWQPRPELPKGGQAYG